jgi:hypothetical protein
MKNESFSSLQREESIGVLHPFLYFYLVFVSWITTFAQKRQEKMCPEAEKALQLLQFDNYILVWEAHSGVFSPF